MRIRLRNPELMPELVRFLRRASCAVELTAPDTAEVQVPDAEVQQASLEVALYLHAWHALHPLDRAEIVC
jgi:hypothetical protein